MQYKDINYREPKFDVDINFTSEELKNLLLAYESLARCKDYSPSSMERSFNTFHNLQQMINKMGVNLF